MEHSQLKDPLGEEEYLQQTSNLRPPRMDEDEIIFRQKNNITPRDMKELYDDVEELKSQKKLLGGLQSVNESNPYMNGNYQEYKLSDLGPKNQ